MPRSIKKTYWITEHPKNHQSDTSYNALKPDEIHLERTPSGRINLTVDTQRRTYSAIRIAHAFPISEPRKYIGLLDCNGSGIGVIEDITELSREHRKIIKEELAQNRPLIKTLKVTRIHRTNEKK